ncbi:hypothetical protein E2C01_040330 [Portunus trituberculatus]|uniref:Uncharacterized protein n=1 Tax=Portunus trituberculatus TaxID=210409 RepID=A0A5B7FMQ1_PORTR|nr:hypothetical protein [Portunus trituberculatus]
MFGTLSDKLHSEQNGREAAPRPSFQGHFEPSWTGAPEGSEGPSLPGHSRAPACWRRALALRETHGQMVMTHKHYSTLFCVELGSDPEIASIHQRTDTDMPSIRSQLEVNEGRGGLGKRRGTGGEEDKRCFAVNYVSVKLT